MTKSEVIRHLVKLIWMVYTGKLVPMRIYINPKCWSVEFYTHEYYREQYLIRGEQDANV